MRSSTLLVLPLLASILCGAGASAQQAPLVPASGATAPLLRLDVVADDRAGTPSSGLEQQDFTLLDNKVPQPITAFRMISGGQAPVEVTLVVDALNILFTNLARENEELAKFLRANEGHLAQPTSLVVFSENGLQVLGGPTRDGLALANSLSKFDFTLRTIRRSQGFYGAEDKFSLSLNALRQLTVNEATRPGRKIVVSISPGWPLLSGPGVQLDNKQQQQLFSTIVSLSTQMRQAEMTLDSVDSLGVEEPLGRVTYYKDFVKGVSKPDQVAVGDLALQVLATQSGGLALNSTGVVQLLQQCVADSESYYQLSFQAAPAERRDEYHHIEVKVAKPGLTARTREGYYAEP